MDIESGRELARESYEYTGPWALAKKKKKGIGERAEAISAQERAARDAELAKSEGTLSAYERTADESSPFYQSLLRMKQRGITGAYRGAKTATRARGAMAGYGYEQPAFQGAEEEVGAREASELGAAPSEALLEATGPELQVAGMRAGRAGIYSPVPYFSEAAEIEREKQRQRGAFWRSLVAAGASVATGGVSSWGKSAKGGGGGP
jgi:hypothetical protein